MEVSEFVNTNTTTSVTSNVTTSCTMSDSGNRAVQKTEMVTTTMTTSVKSVTTISESSSDTMVSESSESSEAVPKLEDMKMELKTEEKHEIVENNVEMIDTHQTTKTEPMLGIQNQLKLPTDIHKFDLKSLTQGTENGTDKPKSTILNVQSVCPNVKPTILKVNDDGSPQKQTRTVLIVNRDGNKVTLAVSKQPLDGSKAETTTIQSTATTATALAGTFLSTI